MTDTGWPVKDVTQRIYDAVSPLAGPDLGLGWPLLTFVNSMGEMFQTAADLVEDGPNGEPGWSIILDIDRAKDEGLDFLGQFIGMHFYTGIDAATKRQQIRDKISWQRGTPKSIIAAVRLFLTGTKSVVLQERDTGPYHFQVTVQTAEAPADTTSLVSYVNRFAKPAGLQWTLVVGTAAPSTYGTIYNRGDLYADLYATFQTYNDVH